MNAKYHKTPVFCVIKCYLQFTSGCILQRLSYNLLICQCVSMDILQLSSQVVSLHLTVSNTYMEVANFCAAMDTLIGQDGPWNESTKRNELVKLKFI